MNSNEIKPKILDCVINEIMKNGIKATTMDGIASVLQMSKRTLYEIFGSKDIMVMEAKKYFHGKLEAALKNIFENSSNVMEGIVKCFIFNRNLMQNVSIQFVRDINELKNRNKRVSEKGEKEWCLHFFNILNKGVAEGYFRDDVNLFIQSRMLSIQMESLKRMEELFPADISLLEVYDCIILGFFRSVCSPKGLEMLDKTISQSKLNENIKDLIYNEQ